MKSSFKTYRKVPCKYGSSCRWLALGTCTYAHEPSQKPSRPGFSSKPHEVTKRGLRNKYPPGSEHTPQNELHDLFANLSALLKQDTSDFTKHRNKILSAFERMNVEDFDLSSFHRLSEIIALINKAPPEFKRGCVIIADQSNLIYQKLLQRLIIELRNTKSFSISDERKKASMIKTARGIDSLFAFSLTIMETIPSTSVKFDIGLYKEIADYLSGDFVKNHYSVCLNEQEKTDRIFLGNIKFSFQKFEETKTILEKKFAWSESRPIPIQKCEDDKQEGLQGVGEERPPNNFREMSVYPSDQEFHNSHVFLRKNQVSVPYSNEETYLDIHFRLLHEDFFSAIRLGFLEFISSSSSSYRNEHLRLRKGRVMSLIATNNFIGVNLLIETRRNSKLRMISRQFMFGSLLLLSKDRFKTYMVCLVKNVDEKNIKSTVADGYFIIQVEVVSSASTLNLHQVDLYRSSLDIIQTKAYFEPYFHVLKALKTIRSLPLKELIVDCAFQSNTSATYLSNMSTINHQGQMVLTLTDKVKQLVANWISNPAHTFDDSQKAAIEHAFNSRIACIQGPPGTGKTYVGVHIVRILLELKKLGMFTGPIFLICYTNHALDQFLGHVLPFTNQITRLGGQTQNPEFKEFTVREKKQKFFKMGYSLDQKMLARDRAILLKDFQALQKKIETSYCFPFIFSEEILKEDEQIFFKAISQFFVKGFLETCHRRFGHSYYARREFLNYFRKRIKGLSMLGQAVLYWLRLLDVNKLIDEFDKTPYEKITEDNFEDEMISMRAQAELDKDTEQNLYKENCDDQYYSHKLEQVNAFMNSRALSGQPNEFENNLEMFDALESRFGTKPRNDSEYINEIFPAAIRDLNHQNLRQEERWWLNCHILSSKAKVITEMNQLMTEINIVKERIEEKENRKVSALIRADDIVAMTTTGAAKNKDIIRDIFSKVIIVEEAAEVLESHISVSLTPTTEHLILIGDHEQLRPKINNFELSKKYSLDISMFERLINSGLKNVRILTQRRMRPEISAITRLLYADLVDAESVYNRPNVEIFKQNVIFLSHQWSEDPVDDRESKQNKTEANFVLKFAELLVKCGYKQESITILSLYSGQLLYMKKVTLTNNLLKGIRIATVDNFQGEENDIILLSLVRSNAQSKIGFLKITNRVNVALSRARLGLFIFGNAKCIRTHEVNDRAQDPAASHWLKVLEHLSTSGSICEEIEFKCPRHPKVVVLKEVSDFEKCPNGGCVEICKARRDCGHACEAFCHRFEPTKNFPDGHVQFPCTKECERLHPCGHRCFKKCMDCSIETFTCKKKINYTHPACKHEFPVSCYLLKNPDAVLSCEGICEKVLDCGHKCGKFCYENCNQLANHQRREGFTTSCKSEVEFIAPCGHTRKRPCGQPVFAYLSRNACKEKCSKALKCQHECDLACEECSKNLLEEGVEVHGACTKVCKKTLICGHQCEDVCTDIEFCSSCQSKCRVRCLHSYCPMKCGEICFECREDCVYKCPHFECTKKCSDLCDRPPCNEPCPNLMQCGHRCLGFCGETCPEICRACDPENFVFKSLYGNVDDESARFIKLECGHCFEAEFMDEYFRHAQNFENPRYANCLECNNPILFCMRYQSQIKAITSTINRIKAKILKDTEKVTSRMMNEVRPRIIEAKKILKGKSVESLLSQLVKSIDNSSMQISEVRRIEELINYAEAYIKLLLDNVGMTYAEDFVRFTYPFTEILRKMAISDVIRLRMRRALQGMRLYCGWHDLLNKLKGSPLYHPSLGDSFKNDILSSLIRDCKQQIQNFDSSKCMISKQKLGDSQKLFDTSVKSEQGVQLRQLEIKEIAGILGLGQGHWFQCPNGHIYAIGECGGAMVKSKCPDCGREIGGERHTLTEGNNHVGWIDGSRRPAYNPNDIEGNLQAAIRLNRILN